MSPVTATGIALILSTHVPPTLLAAEEATRTSIVPAYYEPLRVAADGLLRVYLGPSGSWRRQDLDGPCF